MQTIHLVEGHGIGNETEAMRQALEYYGYDIIKTSIGRPDDFFQALQKKASAIILNVHGLNEKVVMPILSKDIYLSHEPKGDLSPEQLDDIEMICATVLLTTGCGLFSAAWISCWKKKGVLHYLAPQKEVAGSSALQFTLRFFYEIKQNDRSLAQAFESAKGIDGETAQFART